MTSALFISSRIIPADPVCSTANDGKPCAHSHNGKTPAPTILDRNAPNYSIDKGQPGDYCLPCAQCTLGSLEHWQGHDLQLYPEQLLPLRVFKCHQGYWIVYPDLDDAKPHRSLLPSICELELAPANSFKNSWSYIFSAVHLIYYANVSLQSFAS